MMGQPSIQAADEAACIQTIQIAGGLLLRRTRRFRVPKSKR